MLSQRRLQSGVQPWYREDVASPLGSVPRKVFPYSVYGLCLSTPKTFV